MKRGNETLIGIDYSLRSPAVTVKNGNTYTFFIFPREGVLKDKYIETLKSAGVVVTIVEDSKTVKDLAKNERINSTDSLRLATALCNAVKPYISNDTKIAIEGISFASPGNTKVQYAGYHYVLRLVLQLQLGLDFEDMYVYAPNSVKKTAGKGNFKKDDMIKAFLETPLLENNLLANSIRECPDDYQTPKAKHWQKPLDDIADSLWTVVTLLNELNNQD